MQLAFALAAAELFRGEAVDGAVKLVVAKQTLGAAGKVPGQFTASAGDVFISHEQPRVAALAIRQLGVGSVGVPDKTVCLPKSIDELQKTKEQLLKSGNNYRLANDKAQDLSVKKLTRNNPTMREKFDAVNDDSED